MEVVSLVSWLGLKSLGSNDGGGGSFLLVGGLDLHWLGFV